ncbi:hypothetical protein BJ085DRAFT_28421 [Dimargaris cristalligena]|uniref:WH1 domain-containing protein n=1 Tax=Dimargaris cristalligena TaxID=215637 RepID=A0A4P9ZRJ3_9FUNG|nr:hypothetical protein BJ085DRAFT_28421 [Dimargaris cristalligena]|eukprot:RKP35272.1 hypothetical protein BJ085DRAFT_28421 [Dimargaris cristalligena]
MPSATLPSPEDKATIKRALPSNQNKILTATVARLFAARPNSPNWEYTHIMGAITFVRDYSLNSTYFLRMVDLMSNRGVIWEQELYDGFDYTMRQPFFYTFTGDEYIFGLDFVDDEEAKTFFKKLKNRDSSKGGKAPSAPAQAQAPESTGSYLSSFFGSPRTSSTRRRNKIDKSQISAPSDFKHVGHVGWDPDKGYDMVNVDNPQWKQLVDQLAKYGITKEQLHDKETAQIVMVVQNRQKQAGPGPADFGFWSTKCGSPAATTKCSTDGPTTSSSSTAGKCTGLCATPAASARGPQRIPVGRKSGRGWSTCPPSPSVSCQ